MSFNLTNDLSKANLTPEEKFEQGIWPIYYQSDLIVGDLSKNVGVVTLWTMRKGLSEGLDPNSYAVVGNLYSTVGINWIVRNTLANPKIRYLVVCGQDLTRSGEELLTFFKTKQLKQLHPEIETESLNKFLNNVEIFDMRGINVGGPIAAKIASLPVKEPFADPKIFAESKLTMDVSPSENTGFRVEGGGVAETWLKVVYHVMRFGKVKPTEYATEQKELLNMVAVVTCEDPDNIDYPEYMPFPRYDLEDYYPQITSKELPQGLSYTYGNRLMNYAGGVDQIQKIINYLKETWFTRRAVATTWNVELDPDSKSPPCLVTIFASIQDDKLYLTTHFRSHDIYNAWLLNVFAIRRLQKTMALEIGIALGPLTVVSHSAHIYEDKWNSAKDTIEKSYPKFLPFFTDHRGMILITLEKGQIKATHQTPEGFITKELYDTTAIGMYKKIALYELVSRPEHYADMGAELQKAEIALKLGINYRQDKPLDYAELKEKLCVDEDNKVKETVAKVVEKIESPTRYVRKGKKTIAI